ncbi:NAD-dependent epimerase/dehydratase family protein [bacterium]|nr:NAD-dependent epimerase/dehydratase family protein [bacterium]
MKDCKDILVTGGAGFIGTNLIKRLLKDGHNVVSIDNYSTGNEENEQEGCTYHNVDIRDAVDFDFFMEEPDVIYHLAALPRIQPSFEFPALTMEIGMLGTMNILEWARNKECKVIYAGSSSVHSGHYSNPYTFSKVMGDELCMAYKQMFGVDTKICRFYNVYGPHQLTEGEYCTVIGVFENQYKEGVELTITGDGFQRRDFTHVDDIVEGLILTSESEEFDLDIVELGRGHNHSINELAEMFGCEHTYIPKRPGEAEVTLCDTSVAKKDIGYNPKVNLEDYVKEVTK